MEAKPSRHRLKWEPRRLDLAELTAWFDDDQELVTCVKQNAKRSVYALRPTASAEPTYFLKYDHPHGIRDIVKTLLRPRVRREYRAGRAVVEQGIAAAEPIACAWRGRRGLLIAKAIPQAREALDVWQQVRCTARRQRYLEAFGAFLHRLLAKGIYHPDLHMGNLLVSGPDDAPAFYLVDLYGCRVTKVLSQRRQFEMLALITGLSKDLHDDEMKALIARILPGEDCALACERILDARIADTRERWRGRRRKIMGGGSRVEKAQTEDGVWRWRPELDRRVVQAAVGAHRNLVFNAPEDLIKRDVKRNLSKVAVAGDYYVVKEWKSPGPWGRFTADHRAWVYNWRLELSGFAVAPFLGWLKRHDGHAYIVMPWIPGRQLDSEILAYLDEPAKVDTLLAALTTLIETLYRWDIFHQDLKLQNIMVPRWTNGRPELVLVDNDAVRFRRPITAEDRAATCRQIRGSILPEVETIREVIEQYLENLARGT